MIIRRPYAFLIRNFRLIHFLILLLSTFIFFKSLNALDFFNEYVDTRQFIDSETLISDTVSFSMIIFSVVLIFAFTSIIVLFNKKDKPILFYIVGFIFYIAFIAICIISRVIISTIILEGIDPRISRIIRDVWFISIIIQIIIVGFSLIRTLGFDVKKFNFVEDLHELKIDTDDDEEIEISTGFDSSKVKMQLAMQKEELKAFFYENKFMIIIVLFLIFIVIPSAFIAKNIIENKRYEIGEIIDLDDFNLKIEGAYLTKKDYKGDLLFKGDNSYLIVMFNIENEKEEERGITLNNLRLEVNGKIYMPTTNHYEYFTDIGTGYNNNKISKEEKNYIAVYIIKDEDIDHEMIIRYADKLKVKNSQISAIYYRTIINPENIDITSTTVNKSLNQDLIIDYKELKGIKLNISNYDLQNEFTYSVNDKTKYIINTYGIVLLLNYSFTENSSFTDFINKNAIITYKYNGNTYNQKISDITPKNYKENEIYLAVSENLRDATEINLVVKVRNTEYIYKIK